jgi:hypothetical protein
VGQYVEVIGGLGGAGRSPPRRPEEIAQRSTIACVTEPGLHIDHDVVGPKQILPIDEEGPSGPGNHRRRVPHHLHRGAPG